MWLIPSKTGFVAHLESRSAGKKKGRRDETLPRGPGLSVTESGGEARWRPSRWEEKAARDGQAAREGKRLGPGGKGS